MKLKNKTKNTVVEYSISTDDLFIFPVLSHCLCGFSLGSKDTMHVR